MEGKRADLGTESSRTSTENGLRLSGKPLAISYLETIPHQFFAASGEFRDGKVSKLSPVHFHRDERNRRFRLYGQRVWGHPFFDKHGQRFLNVKSAIGEDTLRGNLGAQLPSGFQEACAHSIKGDV